MKELKRVSRWIRIDSLEVTKKHSLYYYADKDDAYNGKYTVLAFSYKNRWYALGQFLNRFGMLGFDKDCKEYPAFISGYDGENYYNPLLMEMDEYGEKVRLYTEI